MKPIRIAAGFLAVSVLAGGLPVAHAQFRLYEGRVHAPRDTDGHSPTRNRGPLEVTVQSEAERQRAEPVWHPTGERRALPESRPQRPGAEGVVVEQWPSEALAETAQADREAQAGVQTRGGHDWIAGLHGYTIGVAKTARGPEPARPSSPTVAAREAEGLWRGTESAAYGVRERSYTGVAGYTVMERPMRKPSPY